MEILRRQANKLSNWKSPGPDGVQGYWIKNLKSLHERLAALFNDCLRTGNTPSWLTRGRTVLIMKDIAKGKEVTNYRPITCLSLTWKLLTSIFSEAIYSHLDTNELLPDEQKGCRKKRRGTKDQLLIDKAIIRNCKRRKTGLAMGWVDYKKAFDMVPHSWILKCLDIFRVADNVKKLLRQSMLNWETELRSGNERLGTVKIKRGIFQGDSLSPLLFVLALIPLSLILRKVKAGYEFSKGSPVINHLLYMDDLKLFGKTERHLETLLSTVEVFSQDIRMEFGISKCSILILKRAKLVHLDGTEIPSGERIKEIDTDQGYKYLGILEADDMKFSEMKSTIKKEYLRRLKVILKSNLNSKNTISAINSRAIYILRYSAGILGWTVNDMKELDRKTRKMLTLHNMFHKKGDVDRLYMSRQEGGRGLISIEDCVLFHYVNESREEFLREVVTEEVVSEGIPKVEIRRNRKERLMNKNLHSVFFVKTDFRDPRSWQWLRNGDLKKATEGTIMAAQEQATRTRSVRHSIDKESVSPLCRLCG